jgi:hypothetical protein
MSNSPLALTGHSPKPRLLSWLYAFVKEWSNVKAARRLAARAAHDILEMREMVLANQKANRSLGSENEVLRTQIEELEGYLRNFQQIDPNAKCPACGHMKGFIRAIVAGDDTGEKRLVMQHNCEPCKLQWAEAPVIEDAVKSHQPDPLAPTGPPPIPLRPPH